jgi:hypothetical protein
LLAKIQKSYKRAKASTLNLTGKASVLATFEVLSPRLKMPLTEPAAGKAQATSTTLREEGNAFYKSGNLAQGNKTSFHQASPLLTRFAQLARNTWTP